MFQYTQYAHVSTIWQCFNILKVIARRSFAFQYTSICSCINNMTMFQAHTSQQKVPKKPIYAPSKHVFGALVCIFEPLKPLLLRNSNLSFCGCKLQATSHIYLHFLTHSMPCSTMKELGFIQSKHFLFVSLNLLSLPTMQFQLVILWLQISSYVTHLFALSHTCNTHLWDN